MSLDAYNWIHFVSRQFLRCSSCWPLTLADLVTSPRVTMRILKPANQARGLMLQEMLNERCKGDASRRSWVVKNQGARKGASGQNRRMHIHPELSAFLIIIKITNHYSDSGEFSHSEKLKFL